MRIEFDLPDWVEGKRISILAGIEQVAEKIGDGPWRVKVARCSMCGRCCQDCSELEVREGYKQPNGEWAKMCKHNERRPYSCCIGDGHGMVPECSIKWETIE